VKVVWIKSLLPTLKEDKRYILYEIMSKEKINSYREMIEQEIRGFIGDLGIARAGLRFVEEKNNRGILQVNRKALHEIKTALALANNYNVRTIKVSGTINKLLSLI